MCEKLFAIGDIHGCFDPFREIVENKIRIRKNDRIVLLGDYIDRGSQSKEVVDYIINLQEKGFDIVPLMGNHESMLLESVQSEQSLYNWFMNGGSETLFSFGVDSAKELDSTYMSFFKRLRYYYIHGKFIFVHAGFNDGLSDPFEDKSEMIWSRRETYSNPAFNGKIIVHGHTPVPYSVCREEVMAHNSVIDIDTGCVYDEWGGFGHLTAIELFSMNLYSV